MKKFFLIGILVLLVGGAAFAAGTIFTAVRAQTPDPSVDGFGPMMGGRGGYGGMMGGRGSFGGGMMGGRWNGTDSTYGPMHEYMVDALADALGISSEELQGYIDDGQTPYQVALNLGFTAEEIPALFNEAHQAALDAAVEAGILTQEQADWMKEHMQYRIENGFGSGRFGPGGCHGGRSWQNQSPSVEEQDS